MSSELKSLLSTMSGWLDTEKEKQYIQKRRKMLEDTALVSGSQIVSNLGMSWKHEQGSLTIRFNRPELLNYYLVDSGNFTEPWRLHGPSVEKHISGLEQLLRELAKIA